MNNKLLAAIVAGGLLVGAGFVTSIVSTPSPASAQERSADASEEGPLPRILGFLEDVLDDLVDDGTIDDSQADAIVEATEQRATELKAEREAERELLRGFLEDGVITEDEASQLPDDHFLHGERYEEAWEDGELTRDELRPHSRRDFFKRGFGFGKDA